MKILIQYCLTFISALSASTVSAQINWSVEKDIASSAFGNDRPQIANGPTGQQYMIWSHAGNLYFSLRDELGISEPVQLNTEGVEVAHASWMGPEMAANGSLLAVVFKQTPETDSNSHIYVVISKNGGKDFGDVVRVDQIGENLSRFSTVAIDEQGNIGVAFMKFDPGFKDPRWVACLSSDTGKSFGIDFEIGPSSSGVAEACDCCPGSLVLLQNRIALIYRNNDENIRDIWVGMGQQSDRGSDISADVDGNSWLIQSCPASGPDAFLLGDSLYTVFMNGGNGQKQIYFSVSSFSSGERRGPWLLMEGVSGVGAQDYPRMDQDGPALACVWRQIRNGKIELALACTKDIRYNRFKYVTSLEVSNASNADIAMVEDSIYLVWQDNLSGTVKFRAGSIADVLSMNERSVPSFRVYPNPARQEWHIMGINGDFDWELINALGNPALSGSGSRNFMILNAKDLDPGIYWLKIHDGETIRIIKLIRY